MKKMKLYSALVYDKKIPFIFLFKRYQNKAEFVRVLRERGFKVNPLMVKPSKLFFYILGHPSYNHDMWKLRSIPKREVQ